MQNIREYEAMAMLDLPDAEREKLGGLAEALTAGFDTLARIDTDGVRPLITVLDLQNVLREDFCEKRFSRDEILKNAPEQYDGHFQVPGTLE